MTIRIISFPAAQLKISYATYSILPQLVKDKLPGLTTCSCGASYWGRTTRRLSARIKEHHPAWLIKVRTGNIRSAIVQHLVDSGHRINPDQAFSVYYQVPSNLHGPVKFRTLCMAKAVGIRILKPVLCIQKQISHPLFLPWPDIHVARS